MSQPLNQLLFHAPILRWDEALPLGSGLVGALLYGENPIRLSLDRSDLWDLRPAPETLVEGYTYAELCRLAKAKKQKEITPRFASFYNNQPHPTKIPAGALEFRFPKTPQKMTCCLDLIQAVARLEFLLDGRPVSLTAFLDRETDLGYLWFEGDCGETLTILPPDYPAKEHGAIDSLSRLGYPEANVETRGDFSCFVQQTAEHTPYAVLCGRKLQPEGVLYIFTVANSRDGGDRWMEQAAAKLQQALEAGWEEAFSRHTAWWNAYHAQSAIRLPEQDRALEQHWITNNYLFASTSRAGCPPLALQGVWTADNGKIPPWKGDYHYDLNVQLSYSHYLAAGRLEEGRCIVDYLLSLAPAGRQFAKEFYGCAGLTLPSVSDLSGRPMGGWAQYSYSPMNHLWTCRLLADYVDYTVDLTLLKERVYPYLKESAEVPLHLMRVDSDGVLRLPVSTSPEYFSNTQRAWFFTETNYDLALLRGHFETLLRYAEVLHNGEEEQWKTILEKLPPLSVDRKGALKIAKGQSYHESHRHQSHAMAIYPLRQIGYDTPGDRRTVDATLRRMEKKGTKRWNGYTFPWASCLYSVAKKGAEACSMLREYLNWYVSPNGFHLNTDSRTKNAYRPFTLEGNFAFNDALQQMLLTAREGCAELFPAVPREWREQGVSFERLRAPGGLQFSAALQENRLCRLTVASPKEQHLELRLDGRKYRIFLREGENRIPLPLTDNSTAKESDKGVRQMKLFALDRKTPLKQFDDLSVLKGLPPLEDALTCHCAKGEYFVLQLLLLSEAEDETLHITTEPLSSNGATYPGTVTCFHTQGIDKWGQPFTKELPLTREAIQPVYFGFQLQGIICDCAETVLRLEGRKDTRFLRVILHLDEGGVQNNGVNDLWRLSRLKWLNSTLEQNDRPTVPYHDVRFQGNALHFLGRTVLIGENGLPAQVQSYFDESIQLSKSPQAVLLRKPMCFDVGEDVRYLPVTFTGSGGNGLLETEGESEHLQVHVEGKVRYEGSIAYSVHLKAKEDCILPDIRHATAYTAKASAYNNGLGAVGGAYRELAFTWNDLHQDCLYTGAVNCGMRIKWKAEQYVRPLVNIYYEAQKRVIPEETWANHGRGNITSVWREGAEVTASTGTFALRREEERVFHFELHFTPLRPVDFGKHFKTRYCHNNHLKSWRTELKRAKKHHLTHIVVHHGNELHPFINYPFIETEEMKKFVKAAHQEGIGVKFYYTSREHSNHMAEVFPYKALGDEIILRKRGKGYPWKEGISPWLKTYFGDNVIPAWRVLYKKGKYKGDHDVSFLVRPDSRLDNYYIEGLRFLTEEAGIDGIYIDDTALDRHTMERARKVLDQSHGLIDMHMWNHETVDAGFVSCANLYTEIFPFLDSLWIGEGFPVNRLEPDYILTEMSGLPYGQTSQMLDEPNGHIGMLYAMNTRYGWGRRDAVNLYRLWDDFGIEQAEMRGYWHSRNPIATGEDKVLVTCYLRESRALLALFNFAKEKKMVTLQTDSLLLGFEPRETAVAPYVKHLQHKRAISLARPFPLRGRSGLLLELTSK